MSEAKHTPGPWETVGATLEIAKPAIAKAEGKEADHLFSRDPGAAQPPPARCEQLHVDGAPTEYWSADAWWCAGCRARFFASRWRDLRHAPCFGEERP